MLTAGQHGLFSVGEGSPTGEAGVGGVPKGPNKKPGNMSYGEYWWGEIEGVMGKLGENQWNMRENPLSMEVYGWGWDKNNEPTRGFSSTPRLIPESMFSCICPS